jgi:hypothetical protein
VIVVATFRASIAALLLGSVLAGCGGGPSTPRADVEKFVVDYVDHNRNNCCELGMHAAVSRVAFARSDPRWAFVDIAVTDINGHPDGHDFLVVRKSGSTWQVLGFGKGSIGCHVPEEIRADLAAHVPDGALSCSAEG